MAQSRFIERTLMDINSTLETSLFAEKIAHEKGLLQRLDPRAKLIASLILLIAVGSARRVVILASMLGVVLVLTLASRVPFLAFLKRVLLVVLIFTSLIALPALFLTPGIALLALPGHLVITRSGVLSASFLLLRVTTSIALVSLVMLTTPWNDVLKALGMLHLPDVIVLILSMTYRYIHLLLHETVEMFTARQSRLLKRMTRQQETALLGATGGVLLNRSLQLSSDVYQAMQSRGFRKYPRTLANFAWHWYDTFVLIFCSSVLTLTLLLH